MTRHRVFVMQAAYDVVGLGNAIVDVIARVDESFLEAHGITRGAMTLIDEPRAEALTNALTDYVMPAGGSGANTIAGIASLEGRGAYIGKVADDALGAAFVAETRAIGVYFDTPPLLNGPATARSIILVTDDGQRSMNTFLGASTLFSTSDLDADLIRSGEITFLEGYLFDREEAKEAFIAAAQIAKSAGRKVAFTMSDSFCVDRHRAAFLELIRDHIDIVFANEAETKSLFQEEHFGTAFEALRALSPLLFVTRSEKGSTIADREETYHIPALPHVKVVDTTGAGDQYAAGALLGLARGAPLPTCGLLGSLAAGEVISHYGPRPETSLAALARARKLL